MCVADDDQPACDGKDGADSWKNGVATEDLPRFEEGDHRDWATDVDPADLASNILLTIPPQRGCQYKILSHFSITAYKGRANGQLRIINLDHGHQRLRFNMATCLGNIEDHPAFSRDLLDPCLRNRENTYLFIGIPQDPDYSERNQQYIFGVWIDKPNGPHIELL